MDGWRDEMECEITNGYKVSGMWRKRRRGRKKKAELPSKELKFNDDREENSFEFDTHRSQKFNYNYAVIQFSDKGRGESM